MRDYELTLVISPDLTSENQKKLLARIKKIITDQEGVVAKTVEWGKKEFAYPIKKKTLGCYFWWEIKLAEDKVVPVDKKIKLEESILRYLLIRKETLRNTKGKGGKHGPKVTK